MKKEAEGYKTFVDIKESTQRYRRENSNNRVFKRSITLQKLYLVSYEVEWATVKFLGTKVACALGWAYTVGTWLYCDYFTWCLSCNVFFLTCFVMCVFYNVWGCFDNCMSVLVICVLVFTVFCIVSFMYIYSYLFCLYWCKDYCHWVTTQLQ